MKKARAALRLLQDEISKTTCRGVALMPGEKPDVSEGNGRDQFQVANVSANHPGMLDVVVGIIM